MIVKLNKSYIAPIADSTSSNQLISLMLKFDVVLILNNYKANLKVLNFIKNVAFTEKGFLYQPTKIVKTQSFKALGLGPTAHVFEGLVVFAFFSNFNHAKNFINVISNKSIKSVSHFSSILNGHLVTEKYLKLDINPSEFYIFGILQTLYSLNLNPLSLHFLHSTKILLLVLNAHIKSVTKRF